MQKTKIFINICSAKNKDKEKYVLIKKFKEFAVQKIKKFKDFAVKKIRIFKNICSAKNKEI